MEGYEEIYNETKEGEKKMLQKTFDDVLLDIKEEMKIIEMALNRINKIFLENIVR